LLFLFKLDFSRLSYTTSLLLDTHKVFTFLVAIRLQVIKMDLKLLVDGEDIDLNEFVVKIMAAMIAGAVNSLRGIKKDWKEINISVKK
jgi:hypothetical protein